jgi:hypothetical protein
VTVKADITEALTVATFAVEVAAVVVDLSGKFAASVVVAAVEEKQLRHSLIRASKTDWDRFVQQEALVPAPWHGT